MWFQDRMIDLKQCTFCQILILMHLVLVRISTSLGLLSETHPLKGYKYLRYIQTKIPVKHGEHRSRLMVTWMICSYDLSTMSAQEKSGTIHLPKSAAFTMDCGRYRGEHTSSKLKLRALFCGHSWMCMNQGMVDSREDIKLIDTNMFPPDNGKKIYWEHPIQEES